MARRIARLIAVPTVLAALCGTPAHAADVVSGEFDFTNSWISGYENTCTESSLSGAASSCAFQALSIADTSKVGVGDPHGTCAGVFSATLHIASGAAGPLSVPGTIELALGSGRFTGRAVGTDGRVVTVEASYSGPKCGLSTPFPPSTHIEGSFQVAMA